MAKRKHLLWQVTQKNKKGAIKGGVGGGNS